MARSAFVGGLFIVAMTVAACGSSASPAVTLVVRDGSVGPARSSAADILALPGVRPQQCAEWYMTPVSQGGDDEEIHVVTTKAQASAVALAAKRVPGVFEVTVAPMGAFSVPVSPPPFPHASPVKRSLCSKEAP